MLEISTKKKKKNWSTFDHDTTIYNDFNDFPRYYSRNEFFRIVFSFIRW